MCALNEQVMSHADIIRNKECKISKLHARIRELKKQVQHKDNGNNMTKMEKAETQVRHVKTRHQLEAARRG